MSNKKSTARHGPSKPINARSGNRPYNTRYVPPAQKKRRIDPFGIGLIAIAAIVAVAIIAFLALGNRGTTTILPATTAGAPGVVDQPATSTALANLSSGPTATAAEVAFQTQVADVPRITVQQAKQLVDAGAKIIDVRPAVNYQQEHVTGAINIPQAEASSHIKDIPKTGTVIMYCECPNDEESAATAKTLMGAGYTNIKVMHGPLALTLWKQAGYPTVASSK